MLSKNIDIIYSKKFAIVSKFHLWISENGKKNIFLNILKTGF